MGTKNINNPSNDEAIEYDYGESCHTDSNQAVMRQSEALMYDDPLLSSSSLTLPSKRIRKDTTGSQDSEMGTDGEETYVGQYQYQCKWESCFQMYDGQNSLVRHIEKNHVELKRGEFKNSVVLDSYCK